MTVAVQCQDWQTEWACWDSRTERQMNRYRWAFLTQLGCSSGMSGIKHFTRYLQTPRTIFYCPSSNAGESLAPKHRFSDRYTSRRLTLLNVTCITYSTVGLLLGLCYRIRVFTQCDCEPLGSGSSRWRGCCSGRCPISRVCSLLSSWRLMSIQMPYSR